MAAENLCYLYYKNYGVPTTSLRYFTVYGPRQRPDMGINKFVRAIINDNEITIYGDGMQTRDFTFVDDAVEANILAAKSNNIGEIFNIGGGNRINVNDLIEAMENTLGKQANVNYIEVQKGDVKDTLADVNKAKEMLKWEPKTDIYLGLTKYIQWCNK